MGAGSEADVDAADFEHATIFSNSTVEGLGSWGDPQNDFQISTGGFKDIRVAYPVPHNIRRNYTLKPFLGGLVIPGAPPIDPQMMINTSFTQASVDYDLDSFTGDYIHFQAYLESVFGPHPGPHLILAGDMSGSCPFGLEPPACYIGPKWASNGRRVFSVSRVCVLKEICCPSYRSYILPSPCGMSHQQSR